MHNYNFVLFQSVGKIYFNFLNTSAPDSVAFVNQHTTIYSNNLQYAKLINV